MQKLANVCLFQVTWFACILGVAQGREAWGISIGVLGVAGNAWLAKFGQADWAFVGKGILAGGFIDTALAHLGLIQFHSPLGSPLSPVWMWVIWAGLMSTVSLSMSWLRSRLVLAGALGALFGPLSYYSGVRLGAGSFAQPILSLLCLAVIWALLTPWLIWTAPVLRQPS